MAIFGDAAGDSTLDDHGKEVTPYRFLLTRENLGVYRDPEGRTGLQRLAHFASTGTPFGLNYIEREGVLEGGGDRVHIPLMIIGANPSVATKELNDNTIRKEIGFAQRLGFGRLVKANASGWRDTKPANLWAAEKAGKDIVGLGNDVHLRHMLTHAWCSDGMVIVAWGKNCKPERVAVLRGIVDDILAFVMLAWKFHHPDFVPLYCFRTNADGSPEHPLYIPYVTIPVPWTWPS